MPDGLYERDILAWSEEQARLLQRVADGEAGVNAVVDWPNLIEEVEAVGRSELRACRRLLRQALVHLLKLHAWPDSRSTGHWRDEAAVFLTDARDAFSPAMQRRMSLADEYRQAVRLMSGIEDDSGPARSLPGACPFTLDDLLGDDPNIHALAARLATA